MNKNIVVSVRFSIEDKTLLNEVCRLRGEDLSCFVRRAVKRELANLSYYSGETKKALGIQERAS